MSRIRLAETEGGENAGLLLDFFLARTGSDEVAARRDLFARASGAARAAADVYRAAFERWAREVKPHRRKEAKVAARLICGLGAGGVLETGITLHHTYGVPMIPGSSLKGVAAAYCESEWGSRDPIYRAGHERGLHKALFGTGDESGCIVFHDAWIVPGSLLEKRGGLLVDVMTPHHTGYYMHGGEANPPAGTDSPVPVAFLSVAGEFRLAVSCTAGTEDEQKSWSALALELLLEAVADWGVGGKTTSGYGRLHA